jgi:hypothetical protein
MNQPVICYYSKHCQHSNDLIATLSRTPLRQQLHYVCIDVRERVAGGMVVVHNNERLMLPPIVTKVPALYFPETNQCIYEEAIVEYLAPVQREMVKTATMGYGEPMCFMDEGISKMCSSWDQDGDALTLDDLERSARIQTPEEDYQSSKMTADDPALAKYMEMREQQVPKIPPKL